MDNLNRLNIRPVRWAAITVAGLVSCKVALLIAPHAAIGLLVGIAVNGTLVLIVVRGARACARGELESAPIFRLAASPGRDSNALSADAQAHTRAREAA